jgi:hypothetical protein
LAGFTAALMGFACADDCTERVVQFNVGQGM